MELSALGEVLKRYWGFDRFLPMQQQAMQCVLSDQDSLVVMPTGGGKSLCYQAPALCRDGLAVVVSPLIALMKDQVDALRSCGIPAAAVNSAMSADERREVVRQIQTGHTRLLYVSPERLLAVRTIEFLESRPISFFAIDEAHCISAWGHDFRPEYRDLRLLREKFPKLAIHAYTATATEHVRQDIAAQLRLRDPQMIVGDFRRPNLHYHVERRIRGLNQICTVLDRYRGQSGIIYCITRAEVDQTTRLLQQMGYSALPYHAGMPDQERTRNQDAFLTEQTDIIVATIAFGMGIDKSNVRFVVHAGMPKSLENYQQESGRAGRDGLDAECRLFYSSRDVMTWKRVILENGEAAREAAEASLNKILDYCTSVTCRHASLVEHFGQPWNQGSCEACDVCLGKLEVVENAKIIGQKILSCVLRVQERFGADYITLVLCGSQERRVLENRHQKLSTWGILTEFGRQNVRQWIEQLVNQEFLAKDREYQVLSVTSKGRQLLRGLGTPKLLKPAPAGNRQSPVALLDSWEGVDRGLFDALRHVRRQVAIARNIPAYIVFSDMTLRDMARRRPATVERFLDIHGVGRQKAADFGKRFVAAIVEYCRQHVITLDVQPDTASGKMSGKISPAAFPSFALFDEGMSVAAVAERLQRALSTAHNYLESYIYARGCSDATRWIPADDFEQIKVIVEYAGTSRLKPIHDALHGRVSYDTIRIAVACLANSANATTQHESHGEVVLSR